MDASITIPALLVLIGLAVAAIGVLRQRNQPHRSRGSEPGDGYHTLESNYSSGLGGHATTWKVPKDPQEYAQTFVPKHRK